MNLYKDKKTGVYKAAIRTAKGRRLITTRQTNLDDAKKVVKDSHLREIERAAQTGVLTSQAIGFILAGKHVTIEKALPEWAQWMENKGRSRNTIENHRLYIHAWAKESGLLNSPPSAANDTHVHSWINSDKDTSKASSRGVKLSAIRSLFDFCAAKGYSMGNPAQLVAVRRDSLSHAQKERKQRSPFSDTEIEHMLEQTSGFWHAAITIGRWTGLRLGDICQLEWDCFAVPGKVSVWTDKRDRRVELDLHPRIQSVLDGIKRAGQLLFPEQCETVKDPKRRSYLSVEFGRLLARSGIRGHSFHDLRSQFCSDMAARGIPVEHIAKAVGHQPYAVTLGYIKPIA